LNVSDLLRALRDCGIHVTVDRDRLVVKAPTGALTAELKEQMQAHKPELLAILGETRRVPGGASATSLAGMADPSRPQLSLSQRRYWYLQRLAGESTVYNGPGGFRLRGPLDRDALRVALQTMVDRHAILRSRFGEQAGEPTASIMDDVRVQIPVTDLSHVPEAEREEALRTFLEESVDERIDLESGPPFLLRLAHLGPDDHALLIVTHSMVWDGWSFDVMLREMKAHYEAALEGRRDGLPPLPTQFTDFAAWQRARLERGEFDRDLEYWQRKLQGPIPSLAVPTDRPRSGATGYEGARVWSRIEGKLLAAIRELARAEGATTYMVLLTALNVLINRYTGVRDVLVASPIQGRTHPELEDLIGIFVNTLFFRNSVDPERGFRSLLKEVKDTCLEAVQHQEVPSELVIESMEAGGAGRAPYELIFVYQQAASRPTTMGPVSVRSAVRGTRRVAVDLVMWVREYDDYLDGGFDYKTSLFDEDRIERMVGHVARLLESATMEPDMPVGDLEYLTGDERRRMEEWGASGERPPAAAVTLAGSAGSVRSGALELRGAELAEAGAGVRGELLDAVAASGARDSARIAVVVDGSVETTLALAAAAQLRIETLFVPGGLPRPAVAELLGAAGVGVLACGPGGLAFAAPEGVAVVELDLKRRSDSTGDPGMPVVDGGSVLTAVPRPGGGVHVVERSWDAVLEESAVVRRELRLSSDTGVAVYADGAADQTAVALLAALGAGSTLVLAEPGLPPDGWELETLVQDGQVDVLIAGSEALSQLIETGWSARLRTVLSGDGMVGPSVKRALRDRADRVVCGWGMSEIGAWALFADATGDGTRMLGMTSAGLFARVVDPRGHPVPQGIPGELWVGGERLARGYRDSPDATSRWFSHDATHPGVRTFRTGERVCWDSDGSLIPLGRADRQRTLNGHRVDLDGLETVLRAHAAIRDVHIVVRRIDGEPRLVACVVPVEGGVIAPAELRILLREQVPPVAIPQQVVAVADIPRDGSGQVDERRVRAQLEATAESPTHVEPQSDAERTVADVWKEALNLDRVGRHDNFFELGGHSLLAVQVTLKIEERLGLRIDPRSMFFNTLEQIVAGAGAEASASGASGP
jgi:non-ribosomal peptide synthetase component F/acyl carrier protein